MKGGRSGRTSAGIINLSTGQAAPWLEDPVESIRTLGFIAGGEWVVIGTRHDDDSSSRTFVAPWRVPAPPRSEWIEAPLPRVSFGMRTSLHSPFLYGGEAPAIQGARFDPKTRTFGKPFPVRFVPGGEPAMSERDRLWSLRGPGIVFSRGETIGSVWLMKLPE